MEDFLYVLVCIIAVIQSILAFIVISCLVFRLKKSKRVCVLVVGDIGRSPRMQNHALSLTHAGFLVDLVGLPGSPLISELQENENIDMHLLQNPPKEIKGLPKKYFLLIKAIFQALDLLYVLIVKMEKCSHILVQNPPTIPTLAITWLVCGLKGSSFVIDWHNYGYSILAMNLKSQINPLVRFATWFEWFFGARSHGNFCVTKAMQKDLKERWNISASVLYDRPVARYRQTSLEEKHQLFSKLSEEYENAFGSRDSCNNDDEITAFTSKGDIIRPNNDRPVLLISSTSWTEDEDFGILLAALEEYEMRKNMDESLPKIVCVITGKGPLKEHYTDKIERLKLKNVKIVTPWLSSEDYQLMIGSADLGVCLHTSSSGLDLPMKVVDMFSCGVPVCAIGFQCLEELLVDDVNGRIFMTEMQLAEELENLLRGFPKNQETLDRYRENLKAFQNSRWDVQWDAIAKPVFNN